MDGEKWTLTFLLTAVDKRRIVGCKFAPTEVQSSLRRVASLWHLFLLLSDEMSFIISFPGGCCWLILTDLTDCGRITLIISSSGYVRHPWAPSPRLRVHRRIHLRMSFSSRHTLWSLSPWPYHHLEHCAVVPTRGCKVYAMALFTNHFSTDSPLQPTTVHNSRIRFLIVLIQ